MLLSLYSLAIAPDATVLVKQLVPPIIPPPNRAFKPQMIAWQPADTVLGNCWAGQNKDYLFVWNSGVVNRTARLISAPESNFGRLGDITITLKPGEQWIFGPIPTAAWLQLDGNLYVISSSPDIMLNPMDFA